LINSFFETGSRKFSLQRRDLAPAAIGLKGFTFAGTRQ
jgi:hypothetical protein